MLYRQRGSAFQLKQLACGQFKSTSASFTAIKWPRVRMWLVILILYANLSYLCFDCSIVFFPYELQNFLTGSSLVWLFLVLLSGTHKDTHTLFHSCCAPWSTELLSSASPISAVNFAWWRLGGDPNSERCGRNSTQTASEMLDPQTGSALIKASCSVLFCLRERRRE